MVVFPADGRCHHPPRHAQNYRWMRSSIVEDAPIACMVSEQRLFKHQLLVDRIPMQRYQFDHSRTHLICIMDENTVAMMLLLKLR